MRKHLLTLLTLVAFVMVGCTEDYGTYYGDYDLNDDDLLDEDEFSEGLYGTWDADEDVVLAFDEFNAEFAETGIFDDWDADDDAYLTEEEFGAGLDDTFGTL